MQTLLALIVVALSVGYALWRAYVAFRQSNDPCYGCGGCPLKAKKERQKNKKAACWHKK